MTMCLRAPLTVAAVVLIIFAGPVWAQLPDGFTQVWPPPGLTDLRCAAAAPDGTVVGGGDGPGLLVSHDGGTTWNRLEAPDPTGLRAVAWGGGTFVAIGADGEPATSTDGDHWVVHEADPPLDWAEAVTWTGQRFVAVGGQCYTNDCESFGRETRVADSSDGSEWSLDLRKELYYGQWPVEVVSRGGVVVAAPFEDDDPTTMGVHGAIVSTDGGQSWQVVPLDFAPIHVTVTTGGFFALGASRVDAEGRIQRWAASSSDGLTWTPVDASRLSGDVQSLAWTGDRFLVVGSAGTATSTDGVQWRWTSEQPRQVQMRFGALLTLADGTVLGFGEQETVVRLQETGWQVVSSAGQPDLTRIASSGSRWVAVGKSWLPGMAPVLVSEDGRSWRQVPVPGGVREISDVEWTGERFVAAAGAVLLTSADGVAWQSEPAPEGTLVYALARNGNGLMAAGSSPDRIGGEVWWSDDGLSWTETATVAQELYRLACNQDGLCVGGGWHGLVTSGRRGETWQYQYLDPENPIAVFTGIAWNGRRWVITGAPGVYSSIDTETWERRDSTSSPVDAAWVGDAFLTLEEPDWFAASSPQRRHGWWRSTLGVSPDGLALGETSLENVRADHLTRVDGDPWILGQRGLLLTRTGPGPGLDAARAHTYLVPAVAHLDGLNGTSWRSDLTVAGWGADADLFLLRSGQAAAEADRRWVTFSFVGSLHLEDVARETFLTESGAGAVLIRSDGRLRGWSRTFTEAAGGKGSYGQFVPMVDVDGLQPVQDLLGLREEPGFRTNLGLINAGANTVTAMIEVRDSLGRSVASRQVDLAPYSYTMLTRFLHWLVEEPVDNAWVRVVFAVGAQAPGPHCLAFASVIDNTSGDPVTVMPARASSGPLVVPVAVHQTGYNGTSWRTDLEVVNTGEEEARFTVDYWPADAAGPEVSSPELELVPGAAARYADVVASLFGTGGKGTLLIRPVSGTLAAASRTYTPSDHGSYGEAVAGVTLAEVGFAGGSWVGLPVEQNGSTGFRTSVGLVNLSAGPAQVLWVGASYPGLDQWAVAAHSLHQLDHALAHETGPPPELTLSFHVLPPSGHPVLGYVSIVDNVTGDPVFYPASP